MASQFSTQSSGTRENSAVRNSKTQLAGYDNARAHALIANITEVFRRFPSWLAHQPRNDIGVKHVGYRLVPVRQCGTTCVEWPGTVHRTPQLSSTACA